MGVSMEKKTAIQCSSGITVTALLYFYEALNDSIGFRAGLSDAWMDVVSREVPVDHGITDSSEFRDAYWAAESFSKMPFPLEGVDRERSAYEKFFDADQKCAVANAALVEWETRHSLPRGSLRRAKDLVNRVLGECSLDELGASCSFGPGATTSLPRSKASQPNKWEFATHITESCLPYLQAFSRFNGGWCGPAELVVVAGNKVTTVPKNAKIDRVIAIEPDWNMFFQRALGTMIRRRLQRSCRLLLPDAQTRNRELAREGSLTGSLATIDLSAASDSISLALCEVLLPPDWFRHIMALRSAVGTVGGQRVTYEKVSSMGNGYTFELETLLFWALARSVSKGKTVSVYGDDIVVETQDAAPTIALLTAVGFEVNQKKTFVAGPFRESCGGHYFGGVDVTPPYFRSALEPMECLRAANRLRNRASQRFGYWADGRFEDMWHFLVRHSKRPLLKGPPALGDSVLHVPWDDARPSRSIRYQKWQVRNWRPNTTQTEVNHQGGLWASLWGTSVSEYSSLVHQDRGYHIGKSLCERWEGPAAWLPQQW